MAASDHLSPGQFYHGSDHHFKVGQVVDPTAPHPSRFESSDADKIYLDARESKAAEYAAMADGPERHVYTVEPLGSIAPDARRNDHTNYDPDDHATAFETSDKVRVVGRRKLTDKELYG